MADLREPMTFGIQMILTDESIGPAALGRAVEERGFAALFLGEHSHIPVRRETPSPRGGELSRMLYRALDPFTALGVVAAVTTGLRLGTGVVLPVQRDPIQTAKEIATLDVVSGGRSVVGVGVGWLREEIRNHGVDPRVRGAVLDERLAAMIEIWTQEQAEYHGEHVRFDPVFAWPKPVQRPYPPIYMGGGSAALARARRFGTGWMPHAADSPEAIRAQMCAAGSDVPVIAGGASPEARVVECYRQEGASMVTFHLPSVPEDEALRTLDEFAQLMIAASS